MSILYYRGKYLVGFSEGYPVWSMFPQKALKANHIWLCGVKFCLQHMLDYNEDDFEIIGED